MNLQSTLTLQFGGPGSGQHSAGDYQTVALAHGFQRNGSYGQETQWKHPELGTLLTNTKKSGGSSWEHYSTGYKPGFNSHAEGLDKYLTALKQGASKQELLDLKGR